MKTKLIAALIFAVPCFAQNTWTNISNGQSIGSFFGVAGTNSEIVGVGIDGRISTRTAASGIWTIQTFTGNPDFRDVIYSNGQYVTVREGGGVMTSSDGLSWNSKTSGTTNDLRALLWDGSNYFAAGANGTILKSSNASTWSSVNSSGPFINALTFSGSSYVAAGGFGLLVSNNGNTWTAPTAPPSGASFEAATWDGSRFIVGGLGGNVYTSLNGQTWSRSNTSITWNVESMISLNGTTWAVGDNAHIMKTTDGVLWDELYPNPIGNEFLMDISQVGDSLVTVGFNQTVLVAAIPEPTTIGFYAGALVLLAAYTKRRNRG